MKSIQKYSFNHVGTKEKEGTASVGISGEPGTNKNRHGKYILFTHEGPQQPAIKPCITPGKNGRGVKNILITKQHVKENKIASYMKRTIYSFNVSNLDKYIYTLPFVLGKRNEVYEIS